LIVSTRYSELNNNHIWDFLALNSSIGNSPMHTIISNNYDEENELEKDIEHLERRLASAKSQITFTAYQKNKQLIS
jgi:hypothetical protein